MFILEEKMKVGIIGKPSAGKSTLFKAITQKDVEIANYPFTTIQPNLGVAFVTQECPCKELNVICSPQNSKCLNHIRLIPINVLDVAGLVPGASEGKGLGNQFLDTLREASVLIHVLDLSGKTDEKGEQTENHDPAIDKEFVEQEIDAWFLNIFQKNWSEYSKKIHMQHLKLDEFLAEKMSGLGITKELVQNALRNLKLDSDPLTWTKEDFPKFILHMRKESKPMIYACNKMDLDGANERFEDLKKKYPNDLFIPTSAECELALKNAADHGFISYIPGADTFEITHELNEKQKHALGIINDKILKKYGSTGIQEALNRAVFDLLDYIVVYPVEDETHYKSKKGNILPDAILLKNKSTALDLAFKIHTEIGEKFVKAIDVRTHRIIAKDHVLKNRDIIKIVV